MQEGGQSMVEVSCEGRPSVTWFVPKAMFDRYVQASVEAANAQTQMREYDYTGRLPEGV